MTVFDDRGGIAVPEQTPPRKITPPDSTPVSFTFDLPSLREGFFRADIMVGWVNEGVESTIVSADVFLRVRNGQLEGMDPEAWTKESLVRFANKKE
jgi:hypothetical protein